MEWVGNSRRINCDGIVEATAEEEKNNNAAAGGGGGLVRREGLGMVEGLLYCKVMTDEQMEVLRKQISVYATICEQLVEMHRAITAQHDSIAGMRLGNMYCDPMMNSGGHKFTARQRWTPSPVQLQILESKFDEGNGTPSKQKIKEIASELSQHGQISETNVYNWFQNRRARSKRKQGGTLASNTESEIDAEVDSPKERKARLQRSSSHENQPARVEDISFQSPEINSEVHSVDPDIHTGSNSSGILGQMFFYDNV